MIQIHPNFPGQNAYLHPTPTRCQNIGDCGNHWQDVRDSGVKFLRIGGKSYDKCLRAVADFEPFFTSGMFNFGFTPVFQLSYYETDTQIWTDPVAAAQYLLQNVVRPLYRKGARYFSIGNEPDLSYATPNQNGHPQNQAQGIFEFISAISDAIRDVYNDANGKPVTLFGPELSSPVLIPDLASGPYNVLPYIDVFTFHSYLFGDESVAASGYQIEATRENIINVLRAGTAVLFANGQPVTALETRLDELATTINAYNTANSTDIKMAITEANICYANDVDSTNAAVGTDDSEAGNGTNGFLAGQFWAELMAVAMSKGTYTLNFWSVIEGSGNFRNWGTDIGYISSRTGNLKSTFNHFKVVAKYFKGDFEWGLLAPTSFKLKAFASNNGSNGVAVIMMNQEVVNSINIGLRLDTGIIQGVDVAINIDFGIANNTYIKRINPQETMLILFDQSGNFRRKYKYDINDYIANATFP